MGSRNDYSFRKWTRIRSAELTLADSTFRAAVRVEVLAGEVGLAAAGLGAGGTRPMGARAVLGAAVRAAVDVILDVLGFKAAAVVAGLGAEVLIKGITS